MAAGIAATVGVDPAVVRIAVVAATFMGGLGPLLYVAAWLALPERDADESLLQKVVRERQERAALLGLGLATGGVLVLLRLLGSWVSGVLWPVGLSAAGVVLVWLEGTPADREAILRVVGAVPGLRAGPASTRQRRLAAARAAFGAALVFGGLLALMLHAGALPALRGALLGTVGVVGGVTVAFGPWWWRAARELAEERRSRVRSQERAEVAAHLHDSVLQTLALIQKAASDPRRVTALARRQERELRAWLWGDQADSGPPRTLAAAAQAAADEVEELHGVPVDLVVVGDGHVDDDGLALIAAAREALVNAAKWSGAPAVSAYIEVEPGVLTAYVRDRGCGFDPAAVGADRRGIASSILERLERRGGKAVVRSAPGNGTEVELRLPRRVA